MRNARAESHTRPKPYFMNRKSPRGRSRNPFEYLSEDLCWTKMYEGSQKEQQSFHGENDDVSASTMSKLVRVTSTSSSNGIGAGPPKRMASTKAAAHAACPLSWRQRFILLNPGQP